MIDGAWQAGWAVGACCDYGWMYEAVICISYVGGHCQNVRACGCCAYAHAWTGVVPWFIGACDIFDFTDDIPFRCYGCGSYKGIGLSGAFSLADERLTAAVWRLGACFVIILGMMVVK